MNMGLALISAPIFLITTGISIYLIVISIILINKAIKALDIYIKQNEQK